MRQLINRAKRRTTTTGVRFPLTGSTFSYRSHSLYHSYCLSRYTLSLTRALSLASAHRIYSAKVHFDFELFFVGFTKRVSVFSAPLSLGVATERLENSARHRLRLAFSDCLCDQKNGVILSHNCKTSTKKRVPKQKSKE